LALLYYPTVAECIDKPTQCHFPGYRAADEWGGAVWLEGGGKSAVVIMGRKGLGDNCYGTPGTECPASTCVPDKGWVAAPYEAQMLFYDPADLLAVVAGTKEPWQVLPYTIHRPAVNLFEPTCGDLRDVTYDAARQLIYVAERDGGPNGETIVHVWRVEVGPDPTPTATPTGSAPTPAPTATAVTTPAPTPAARLFVPFVQRR
jgi:hypothetical protein